DRTGGGSGRVAIGELAVLTDVDAGGAAALATMAQRVAAGGPEAAGAEHHLASVGAKGATALVAAARASRDPAARARVRAALARLGPPAGPQGGPPRRRPRARAGGAGVAGAPRAP